MLYVVRGLWRERFGPAGLRVSDVRKLKFDRYGLIVIEEGSPSTVLSSRGSEYNDDTVLVHGYYVRQRRLHEDGDQMAKGVKVVAVIISPDGFPAARFAKITKANNREDQQLIVRRLSF